MNVAVVYSLPTRRALAAPYAETEQDTVDSAGEVARALKEKGAMVTMVPIDEDHIDVIRRVKTDCIVNLIDWTGLDLPLSDTAFSEIEKTGIPVTGASRANYMLTSDKVTMKQALDANNLPTPRWQLFRGFDEPVRDDFQYPVIVKLALEHCSIGLTHDAVVENKEDLITRVRERRKEFHEPVFAEEFLSGREFQVTVLHTEGGLRVLPPAEITYQTKGVKALLTYASRWDENDPDYDTSDVILAKLSSSLADAIEKVSIKTFQALTYRDYIRLDLRMRGESLFILEANSNPGLSHSEDYGMTVSYMAAGMTFADFVWEIVLSALRRARKQARG